MSKIFIPDCRDCKFCEPSKAHGRDYDRCEKAEVRSNFCDYARKDSWDCGMKGKYFTSKDPEKERQQKIIETGTYDFENHPPPLGQWMIDEMPYI